jgi:hypothetical protein
MPPPLENVIVRAVPNLADWTVALEWASGAATVSSFRHLLSSGVMKRLADPVVFAQVSVGERGRSLAWPGEVEFCADALWFDAHPQDNPYQQVADIAVAV